MLPDADTLLVSGVQVLLLLSVGVGTVRLKSVAPMMMTVAPVVLIAPVVQPVPAPQCASATSVIAPHDESAKIANVDLRVGQGDVVKVGSLLARVLETPGHTLDHISYVFDNEKALFAADTLFSIGCGRVFEGTYDQMWDSLLKLRALPDDFKLYCGHEYTASNIKFALTVEPDNAALKARAEEVTRLRAANKPTIPTLLADEKKANVFLRADEPSVAANLHMKGRGAAEVFAELRERKNKS